MALEELFESVNGQTDGWTKSDHYSSSGAYLNTRTQLFKFSLANNKLVSSQNINCFSKYNISNSQIFFLTKCE